MSSGESFDYADFDFGAVDFGEESDEIGLYDMTQSETSKPATGYSVLTEKALRAEMREATAHIQELLGLKSSTLAKILLAHANWNTERLLSDYSLSDEAAAKYRAAAGISKLKLEKRLRRKRLKVAVECPVCLEDVLGKNTFALNCGHRYCVDCWKSYLELNLTSTTDGSNSRCPHPQCNELVHEKAFKRLVSKTLYKRYTLFAQRSQVRCSPTLKYCPAPNCAHILKVERRTRLEPVRCHCGFSFCFQCADYNIGDHEPASCQNMEDWTRKATDESANVLWMIANTKKCPKCRNSIEKNGGCMHITCSKKSAGCGHEFCWLCRGPWSEHGSTTGGYYNCNKYDASQAKDEDLSATAIKTELDHYMFYYHRYESHHNAMKIAETQIGNAEAMCEEILTEFRVRDQDTQFIHDAAKQLLANYRVLANSYVYGFYLEGASEKNLFEYIQEDLEKYTTRLSELFELPLARLNEDYDKFLEWREKVTNATRVTFGYLDKFVRGVAQGLTTEG
eukprot:TRINITY_DN1398_c0_g1_i2.p1 TRINITY_DN1398_c0_g1~~TRINITY_DN1398_c0_g1_i2.p1  ORF type:complete len:508 (-),score=45.73 TRINITY_DN1398_c0_g1_i2:100-1623(-)